MDDLSIKLSLPNRNLEFHDLIFMIAQFLIKCPQCANVVLWLMGGWVVFGVGLETFLKINQTQAFRQNYRNI